jgi:hypothetical protein
MHTPIFKKKKSRHARKLSAVLPLLPQGYPQLNKMSLGHGMDEEKMQPFIVKKFSLTSLPLMLAWPSMLLLLLLLN